MRAFCPACGEGWEGGIQCGQCGTSWWLNPAPAVCGILLRAESVLLIKRPDAPFKNCWDLPGGFVETHEPLEAALQREFMEETGLVVTGFQYLGAWPDVYVETNAVEEPKHTINIVFTIQRHEEAAKPLASEEGIAEWWPLQRLPVLAFPNSTGAALLHYSASRGVTQNTATHQDESR